MAMLTVDAAQALVLGGCVPLPGERVPLAAATGRTLAEDLAARRTQPPFAASAMDGYAVRAADCHAGATLMVKGTAPAGHAFDGTVETSEAVRIFTGAPVPDGADTILIQEDTVAGPGTVTVTRAPQPGRHIRGIGVDFREGQVLLTRGTRLDWRSLSLAAAMDHAELLVCRPPLVAILATGDELVPPGHPRGPADIVASNSYGIAALVAAAGGRPLDLGIAPDAHAAISAKVTEALDLKADILVTLGGASVGDLDLIRPVLGDAGMDLDFWKIAMRPGKPLMSGRLGATRVIGLPGNPVSSMVAAKLFLEPLIRALQGDPAPLPRLEFARAGRDLPANDSRRDYLRGRLVHRDGEALAIPVDNQDSSLLSRLSGAEILIPREIDAPALAAGAPVGIIRLA